MKKEYLKQGRKPINMISNMIRVNNMISNNMIRVRTI